MQIIQRNLNKCVIQDLILLQRLKYTSLSLFRDSRKIAKKIYFDKELLESKFQKLKSQSTSVSKFCYNFQL